MLKNLFEMKVNAKPITIGMDDEFYKSLNFSDEEIKLMREQEKKDVFEYKKVVLDRFNDAIEYYQRATGKPDGAPDSIQKFLEAIQAGYDAKLPVCLLVDKVEGNEEFSAIANALINGINIVHLAGKGYGAYQLGVISRYKSLGYDLDKYVKRHYDSDQMDVIGQWLVNGLDLDIVLDGRFSSKTMRQLGSLLLAGIDIKEFWDTSKWNVRQLEAILYCIIKGIPVHRYVTREHSSDLIRSIGDAIEVGIPYELINDVDFDDEVINNVVNFIKEGRTLEEVKFLLNVKYDEYQVEEIIQGMKDGLDVSKFSDWRLEPKTIRNLRLIALEDKQGLEPGSLSRDDNQYEDYNPCTYCDCY